MREAHGAVHTIGNGERGMCLRLTGVLLLIVCGGAAGAYLSAEYRRRTALLERVAELLLEMSMMMDFECPTVDVMMSRISGAGREVPRFMKGARRREDVLSSLAENPDGFEGCDLSRLTALFSELGRADKQSELTRLDSARAYFARRADEVRTVNGQRSKLALSLGILGGIFAAVIMI